MRRSSPHHDVVSLQYTRPVCAFRTDRSSQPSDAGVNRWALDPAPLGALRELHRRRLTLSGVSCDSLLMTMTDTPTKTVTIREKLDGQGGTWRQQAPSWSRLTAGGQSRVAGRDGDVARLPQGELDPAAG